MNELSLSDDQIKKKKDIYAEYFFEQEYMRRKFYNDSKILDKSFRPHIDKFSPDLYKLFKNPDGSDITNKNIKKMYNDFREKIYKFININYSTLIGKDFKDLISDNKTLQAAAFELEILSGTVQNSCDNNSVEQIITGIIDYLQYNFLFHISNNKEVLQKINKIPTINLYNPDEEDKTIILIFFFVSCKYSLYISNLLSNFDIDQIIKFYINNNYIDFKPKTHPNIDELSTSIDRNEYENLTDRNKASIDKFIRNSNLPKSYIDIVLKKMKNNNIIMNSNTISKRLMGLWIYDMIQKEKLKKYEAIKKFYSLYPSIPDLPKLNEENLRHFNKWINVTQQCIDQGKVISITSHS